MKNSQFMDPAQQTLPSGFLASPVSISPQRRDGQARNPAAGRDIFSTNAGLEPCLSQSKGLLIVPRPAGDSGTTCPQPHPRDLWVRDRKEKRPRQQLRLGQTTPCRLTLQLPARRGLLLQRWRTQHITTSRELCSEQWFCLAP